MLGDLRRSELTYTVSSGKLNLTQPTN